MTSMSEFSNRELQKMNIHKLRILARQVGVPSPSNRHKDDLINCIVDIILGKKAPDYKNKNRGRPSKTGESHYNIANYQPMFSPSEFSSDFLVANGTSDYSLNKKNDIVSGIISEEGKNSYIRKFKFAETADDISIDAKLIELYNLKNNDVVTYTQNNNGVNIHTVNGESVCSKGIIALGDKEIFVGKRNITFASSIVQKRDILLGLSSFGKVIYIPGNHPPVASSSNILAVPLELTTDEEIINNFCEGCDIAQFCKNDNKEVLLVIDNFLSVISAIKQFEPEKSARLEKEVFAKIDSLTNNGITFVGIMPSTLKSVFGNVTTTFDNIS